MSATLVRALAVAAAAACIAAVPSLAQDTVPTVSKLAEGRSFAARDAAAINRRFERFTLVAIDGSGRVVVEGTKFAEKFGRGVPSVARFLPNGRLDRTFGRRGIATLPLAGYALGLSIDTQSRVLVTGAFTDVDNTVVLAARLDEDGRLDPAFSLDGLVEASGQVGDYWRDGRAGPDGSLVVSTSDGTINHVLRVTPTGRRDVDFGVLGDAGFGTDAIHDLAVDAQGRVVVASASGVVRLLADGTRDLSFGADGTLATAQGVRLVANQVGVDAQGRIVAYAEGLTAEGGVHRFLADGAVDTSFSGDGVARRMGALPPGELPYRTRFVVAHGAADRYVLAGSAFTFGDDPTDPDHLGTTDALVQSIDGSAPEDVALRSAGSSLRRRPEIHDVAVSPDGATAVVVGEATARSHPPHRSPYLRRVRLAPGAPYELPDIALSIGSVTVQTVNGQSFVQGYVGVRNRSAIPCGPSEVAVFVSDDDVLDASDDLLTAVTTEPIPARDEITVPVLGVRFPPLVGRRLIATFDRYDRRLVANSSAVVVVSPPLE